MSFKAAAWAIQQKPNLATEKLILIGLSDHHNKDSNRCDPSMRSLADIGLCSERTAIRSIESLENQGYITTIKELGKRTKYALNFDKTTDTHVTGSEQQISANNGTPDILSPVTPVTQTTDTHVTTPLTPMSLEPVSNQEEPGKDKDICGIKEKSTPPKKPPKRFKKPSAIEASNYFFERGSETCNDEADGFIDFYESKGWKVGKNPMKDWKAAIRNWIRNSANEKSNRSNQKESTRDRVTRQTNDRSWAT